MICGRENYETETKGTTKKNRDRKIPITYNDIYPYYFEFNFKFKYSNKIRFR